MVVEGSLNLTNGCTGEKERMQFFSMTTCVLCVTTMIAFETFCLVLGFFVVVVVAAAAQSLCLFLFGRSRNRRNL